jgi:hypothetical protein
MELDFSKLLGFNRVAAAAGNGSALAKALGSSYNKAGETATAPDQLAKALGSLCTKVGEPAGFSQGNTDEG